MGIVALQAISPRERLVVMRLLQTSIFGVVAVEAQRRCTFGQVELVFRRQVGATLVRRVAGVAAHIEGCVAAAFLRNIGSLGMAARAEVLFLVSRGGLQQLVLVVRSVRIVAAEAVAYGRLVHMSFDLRCVFFGVAIEAKLIRNGRDQLHPGHIFVDPYLVATQASHLDRGVN